MRKTNGYWNYEKCYQEALKYKSRWNFGKSCGSAYIAARKNKWLDILFPIKKVA